MLALLVLLQAAQLAAADDAIVIGRRLDQDFKANVRFGKDGARCRVGKSTGDAEIDRVGCTALEVCVPPFESRLATARDRAIRPEVKKLMRGALAGELATCVGRERSAGVAALAARRRAARSGG